MIELPAIFIASLKVDTMYLMSGKAEFIDYIRTNDDEISNFVGAKLATTQMLPLPQPSLC